MFWEGPEVHSRRARCPTTWQAAPCPTARRPNFWRRCRHGRGACEPIQTLDAGV